ncbi:MAG: hypothetical protein KC964_26445 [Candidatus Omnitrophica bacterium]|nr:hypothetical protein [Candidatus Omnitrophota bacterium]
MTNEEICHRVALALRMMRDDEADLIEMDANERSITHRFAVHLESQFEGWNVDCEYNRDCSEEDYIKRLPVHQTDEIKPNDDEAKTVFPDIIVHKRNQKHNLLVIEMKKTGRRSPSIDESKLKAFTGLDFAYRLGILLMIPDCFHGPFLGRKTKLFKNGEVVEANRDNQ